MKPIRCTYLIIAALAFCVLRPCAVAQDAAKGAHPPDSQAAKSVPPALPPSVVFTHNVQRLVFSPPTASGKAVKAAEAMFEDGEFQDALDMCHTAQQLIAAEGKAASYDERILVRTIGFSLVELGQDGAALKRLLPWFKHQSGGDLNLYTAISLARTGEAAGAAKLLGARNWNYFSPAVESLWKVPLQGDPAIELVLLARHYLGEDSMSVGEVKQALRHFKAAEAVDSHSTLVQYDLGMAYTKLGRYKDAAIPFAWAAKAGNPDLSNAAKLQLEHVRAIMKSMAVKPASKQ